MYDFLAHFLITYIFSFLNSASVNILAAISLRWSASVVAQSTDTFIILNMLLSSPQKGGLDWPSCDSWRLSSDQWQPQLCPSFNLLSPSHCFFELPFYSHCPLVILRYLFIFLSLALLISLIWIILLGAILGSGGCWAASLASTPSPPGAPSHLQSWQR